MNIWTCRDFKGFWPVGTAAVIVADSLEKACELLEKELAKIGLPQTIRRDEVIPLNSAVEGVRILHDGDY